MSRSPHLLVAAVLSAAASFVARPVAALSVAALPVAARAAEPAEVAAPQLHEGDSWVFDRTLERGTTGFMRGRKDVRIESIDADGMVVGVKPDGAPVNFQDHLEGTDWSKRRNVDGKEVVIGRPFAFPLSIGKSWTADYDDSAPRGNQLSARFHAAYRVAGWADVTTPAGVFHALKIEVVTNVEAHMAASTSTAVAGSAGAADAATAAQVTRLPDRMVHETWREQLFYVPELKYYAKFVSERYNADEVRILRDTELLAAYKVQP